MSKKPTKKEALAEAWAALGNNHTPDDVRIWLSRRGIEIRASDMAIYEACPLIAASMARRPAETREEPPEGRAIILQMIPSRRASPTPNKGQAIILPMFPDKQRGGRTVRGECSFQ